MTPTFIGAPAPCSEFEALPATELEEFEALPATELEELLEALLLLEEHAPKLIVIKSAHEEANIIRLDFIFSPDPPFPRSSTSANRT
jgi:hypothetical protein